MNASQNDIPNEADADGDDAEELMLYALGALDPADAERVAQQVASDPDAQRALAEAEELVGRLGTATPLAAAPPDLRARVFDRLDETQAPPAPGATQAEIIPFQRRSRTGYALAAIAAALILLLGSVSAVLWQRLEDRTDELDALQAELARVENFDQDQPLVWTPLVSADGSDTVTGWLCRTPDGEVAWVILQGEPVAPEHVLQLWLIDDQPHSAGTLVSDADGRALTVLVPDRPVTDFTTLGITVEPEGGSPAPTTDPFAFAEIS